MEYSTSSLRFALAPSSRLSSVPPHPSPSSSPLAPRPGTATSPRSPTFPRSSASPTSLHLVSSAMALLPTAPGSSSSPSSLPRGFPAPRPSFAAPPAPHSSPTRSTPNSISPSWQRSSPPNRSPSPPTASSPQTSRSVWTSSTPPMDEFGGLTEEEKLALIKERLDLLRARIESMDVVQQQMVARTELTTRIVEQNAKSQQILAKQLEATTQAVARIAGCQNSCKEVHDYKDLDDNVLHNQLASCSNPDEVRQNSYKTVVQGMELVECNLLVVNPVNGVNHTSDEAMHVNSHDVHSGAISVDGIGSEVLPNNSNHSEDVDGNSGDIVKYQLMLNSCGLHFKYPNSCTDGSSLGANCSSYRCRGLSPGSKVIMSKKTAHDNEDKALLRLSVNRSWDPGVFRFIFLTKNGDCTNKSEKPSD